MVTNARKIDDVIVYWFLSEKRKTITFQQLEGENIIFQKIEQSDGDLKKKKKKKNNVL